MSAMRDAYRRPTTELGPLRTTHAPDGVAAGYVGIALFLVVLPCATAIGLLLAAVPSVGLFVVAGAVAGAPTAFALWLIARMRRARDDLIEIHALGVRQRLDGRDVDFAWSDVAGCRTTRVMVRGPAGVISSSDVFALALKDGRRVTIDTRWKDPLTLGAQLRVEVRRARVAAVRETFARGEPMRFGDLSVDRERGAMKDGEALPWSELSRAAVERSFVTLYRATTEPGAPPEKYWAEVELDSLDDPDTLLALLDAHGDVDALEPRADAVTPRTSS
jgi:hypothetical protein